jgi:Holliday junction resolvasome RuvABC endonuclease subunit
MEKVKILGVDPSLRNTGLAVVTYNTELPLNDPAAFTVSHCQVLVNPQKYTGTEAILNMLDMINEEALKNCYRDIDNVIVESPAIMFNKKISSSVVASLAHISGGAVALFGIEKSHLFRPNEWNKTRKKDITHNQTIAFLGSADKWHYEQRVKSEKYMEHILDAVSMSLWWIKSNYFEE